MNILKVNDITKSRILGFVNNVLLSRCPNIFLTYFTIKRSSYDMRTKKQLETPQTRLQLGDRAVKVKGCLLWNSLDKSMLKYRLCKSFKRHIVKYYISTYTY